MLSLEGNPADELEGRQRINSKDTPEGSLLSLKAEASACIRHPKTDAKNIAASSTPTHPKTTTPNMKT
jgi:hypothetical protein